MGIFTCTYMPTYIKFTSKETHSDTKLFPINPTETQFIIERDQFKTVKLHYM